MFDADCMDRESTIASMGSGFGGFTISEIALRARRDDGKNALATTNADTE